MNGPYYGGPGESCFNNGHNGGACGYNVHNGLDTYGTGGNHNGKCGSYLISCYGTTTYLNGGQGQGSFWVRADTFGTTRAGFPFTSGSPGETITWTADPIISGVTSLRLLLQSKGSASPYYVNGVKQPLFPSLETSASRSLKFVLSSEQYLQRTPTIASNRKTFTFSAWIKLTKADMAIMDNGNYHPLISAINPSNGYSKKF